MADHINCSRIEESESPAISTKVAALTLDLGEGGIE